MDLFMADEGFFWGKDGGKYKSIFERNAADARYEQQEKQNRLLEEQNQIEQQRLQMEQQKVQDNQRRIEQEKKNQEELLRSQEREAQKRRNDEEIQRLLERKRELEYSTYKQREELCVKANVDWNIVRTFIETLQVDVDNTEIDDIEVRLENLQNSKKRLEQQPPSKEANTQSYEKQIEARQRSINYLKENNQWLKRGIFTPKANKEQIKKNLKTIQDEENKIKQLRSKVEREKTEYQQNIGAINKEYKEKIKQMNIEISELQVKLKQLKLHQSSSKEEKINDFIEFRKNHYNTDMELLFIELYVEEIPKISSKEKLQEGTKEDYLNYMKEKILEG